MKIEKLHSGSYRVRKTYEGKTYSVTFDRKPTQKEAMQAISAELDRRRPKTPTTFQDAALAYVDSKENVLSPKTVREYLGMSKRIPEWFRQKHLHTIQQSDLNLLVNELAGRLSAKTVHDYHGFVVAVMNTYAPWFKANTTLPKVKPSQAYMPTKDDVVAVLQALEGTEFEIPFILGCYGMRRSEICALDAETDLDGDVLRINKALVEDKNNNWVIKDYTKTEDSIREIVIPEQVADKIRARGYVYRGFPGSITNHIEKVQDALGIPRFSLHKCRHYFVAQLSELQIPSIDIQRLGGWKTDHVMNKVYNYSLMERDKEKKRDTAKRLSDQLFL